MGARRPAVCRDIRAWVASGYTRLPADVTRATATPGGDVEEELSEALAALGYRTRYPERAILQLLRPYQHQQDRVKSRQLEERERLLVADEMVVVRNATMRMESVLGLASVRNERRI